MHGDGGHIRFGSASLASELFLVFYSGVFPGPVRSGREEQSSSPRVRDETLRYWEQGSEEAMVTRSGDQSGTEGPGMMCVVFGCRE